MLTDNGKQFTGRFSKPRGAGYGYASQLVPPGILLGPVTAVTPAPQPAFGRPPGLLLPGPRHDPAKPRIRGPIDRGHTQTPAGAVSKTTTTLTITRSPARPLSGGRNPAAPVSWLLLCVVADDDQAQTLLDPGGV